MADSKQEYSSRTLGATWGIISAVMLPIVIVLICIGWRILKKKKAEEREEEEYLNVKTRPIDPDESVKVNSDDESIPYKKEVEDSPEPTDPVKVVDSPVDSADPAYGLPLPYGQYDPQTETYVDQPSAQTYPEQPSQAYAGNQPQSRQWGGETEIN